MAKRKNKKVKEEVIDFTKPEKITAEQLKRVQDTVNKLNRSQLEMRKHQALHFIAGVNDELTLLQEELKKEYNTDDVNIQTGIINYPTENGEADKKD